MTVALGCIHLPKIGISMKLSVKKNDHQKQSILGKNTKSYKKFKKGDTPLKVQFCYQDNINLPQNTFSRAWQSHWFDFCLIFTFLLENWLFAGRFSNCSKSLNFEAMTNRNTSKENFKKWRTKCTGIKLDFEPFYSRQMQIEKVNS